MGSQAEAGAVSVLKLMDRPIAFQRSFVRLGIGVTGALMLSQAMYWSNRTGDEDGWFYKSQGDWEQETGLTRTEQETARKRLRAAGFWIEKRRGVPAKLYFKIDANKLEQALQSSMQDFSMQESCKLECGNPANKDAETLQTGMQESCEQECGDAANSAAGIPQSITEITTETTAEITPERLPAPDLQPVDDEAASAGADDGTLESDPDDFVYVTKRGKKLRGDLLERFNQFWEAFDYRKGKAEAADAWLAKVPWRKESPEHNNALLARILLAAEFEALQRPAKLAAGTTPIYPEGWLSGRRWEDESVDLAANQAAGSKAGKRDAITAALMDIHDANW